MTRFLANILAVATALTLTLSGCVNEDSPCNPSDVTDDVKVALSFTITAPKGINPRSLANTAYGDSRADDCNDDRIGTIAENYIKVTGCQFLIFDENRMFLTQFFPTPTGFDSENYLWYTVKAEIINNYFTAKVKEGGDVTFYIMVLANTGDFNPQALGLFPGKTSLENLTLQNRTFTLPGSGQLNDGTWYFNAWRPDISNSGIPMAGLQKFTVTANALKRSTMDIPVDLSAGEKNIDMLRSLAKIEVVDQLPKSANYEIYVEKVELVGFYRHGTLLPSIGPGNQWPDYVSQQITEPTLPDNSDYTAPTEYSVEYSTYNKTLPFIDDEAGVFTGYVNEYSRTSIGTMVKPYIVVTVNNIDKEDSTNNRSVILELKLDKYNTNGGPIGDGIEYLLRNHIYRFEITGVSENLLQGTWTVCPWAYYEVNIPPFN